jgi:glycoprotein endo-alpha-1,2-mannosidase
MMRLAPFLTLLLCGSSSLVFAEVNVAAYYYPWHAGDFHRDQGYLREHIGQAPLLGEYDDRDPAVVQQHLEWSLQANIGVWITSWFGPNSREDTTLLSAVLPTIQGTDMKFALFYETVNRIGKDTPSLHRVVDDINHIIDNFTSHPNYLRINGQPVLVIYLTRTLEQNDVLAEALLLMRSAGVKRDTHFYLVGDHAFGSPPAENLLAFDYLDAVTNYDVYGLLGSGYVGEEKLAMYYAQQGEWKARAKEQNCAYLPAVTPGFNDRGVRLEVNHLPLSRKLNTGDEFGTLFRASLEHAMLQVDPDAGNFLVVTSFNEWHEDTQIEPTVGALTNKPFNYTLALEYEGYGTRYLDILAEVTRPDSGTRAPSPVAATPVPMLPQTPAPAETKSPAAPTKQPTFVDPNDPDTCDDSKFGTFPTLKDGNKRCIWLASRAEEQLIYCQPNEAAYHLCEETCSKCTDDCEDTLKRFDHQEISRDCLWLSLRTHVQDVVCVPGHAAYDIVCPETCDSCDGDAK